MKRKRNYLIIIIVLSCLIMAIVDSVIQPGYFYKSLIKVIVFLSLPIFYSIFLDRLELKKIFKIKSAKSFITSIFIGIGIYIIILLSFFILRNFIDMTKIVPNIDKTLNVNKDNFIFVALYISFVNSLLEEFFFRGVGFLKLKEVSNRKFSYFFSSFMFAMYHIAMMIGWFSILEISLVIICLIVAGFIFNYANEKTNNIYRSWIIHMFANFSINTVGFILLGIINI